MNKRPNPVERAIEIVGTQAELARLTGVTPQMIYKATKSGKTSPDLAVAIEKATKGEVPKEILVWGDIPEAVRAA